MVKFVKMRVKPMHHSNPHPTKRFIWIAIALVCLAGSIYAYSAKSAKKDGDAGSTTKAEKNRLEVWFQELGEIEPKTKVDVKSSVTGKVMELFVREGDAVRSGQRLAVVQPGRDKSEGYHSATVTAPMAGIVIKKNAEIGDSVVSGMAEFGAGNILYTVADLSRMIVKFNVNEVDVGKLSVNQSVRILLDAFPNETFDGRITFISPMAEKNDQKLKIFRTEVDILAHDPRLRPGMTARIKVLLAEKNAALLVPLESLFDEDGKWVAYVSRPDKKPEYERRVLHLGLQNDMKAEILSGLNAGEILLLKKPKS